MRTFTYTDDASNKFWNIEHNGTTYTITFGRIGTKGQTQTKLFDTVGEAKNAHDKLVAEKLKKGYVETTPQAAAPRPVTSEQRALEAALVAHPDEGAAHSAYADYLTEQDDPRGEFVQAQLALEDPARSRAERDALGAREADLLKAHAAEWMGDVGRYLVGDWSGDDKPYGYRFARGWLDAVRALPVPEGLVAALARAPQARMLRRLEIVYDMRFHPFDFDPFVETMNEALPEEGRLATDEFFMSDPSTVLPPLATSPHLTNLRVLKYGFSDDHPNGPSHSTMVSPFHSDPVQLLDVLKVCPRLEELYLNTDVERVEEVFASELLGNLRVFQYYYGTGRYNDPTDPYPLSALAENAALGHLHTLRFHPGRDAGIALGELAALVTSPNLPALKHLQVHLANFGDDGAEMLVASGVLKRLKTLDIGYGNLTDGGAHALAACPDLKNLDALAVSHNALTAAGIDALKRTGVAVAADAQHPADGDDARDYRYSVDWE